MARPPTWVYRFSFRSGVFGSAVHCIDVPFWFDCLDSVKVEPLTGPEPPQALADATHAGAVAFITSRDPGWTAWSAASGATRVLGGAVTTATEPDGYASLRSLL